MEKLIMKEKGIELLPFEISPVNDGVKYDTITAEDTDQIIHERFRAWYDHQEEPVIKAINKIMIDSPKSELDSFKNLLCMSFLYAKRAGIRVTRLTKAYLDEKYSKNDRKDFSLQDVFFQQEATRFLLNCENQEIKDLFWEDFELNQEVNRQKKKEGEGAKRGILSAYAAVQELQSENYQVFFPDPYVDAREKIDLIAEKDGEIAFIQVKSSEKYDKKNKGKGNVDKKRKLEEFFDSVERYRKKTGLNIVARVMEM